MCASEHPFVMPALVKTALPTVSIFPGKRPLHFAAAERPDNAGAMPAVVRIGRADSQFMRLRATDLSAALHELPAVEPGALLKAHGKMPVDQSIQLVFEELVVGPANFLVEGVGYAGKGVDQRRIEETSLAFPQDLHG